MDAIEARDHVEMIDRILAEADTQGCADEGAGYYIVWGIFGALANIAAQLVFVERHSPWLYLPVALALGVAIALSMYWANRERGAARVSQMGRFINFVFSAAILSAAVAAIAGYHVLPRWGGAVIWSVAIAIPLLVLGFMGHRRSLYGGIALLASIVAANFVPVHLTGYALAVGMLAMTATGLVMFFAPKRRG